MQLAVVGVTTTEELTDWNSLPLCQHYIRVYFLHILATVVVTDLFYSSHPGGYEMVFHCGFDLHFLEGY
jgi:hypothetical protein